MHGQHGLWWQALASTFCGDTVPPNRPPTTTGRHLEALEREVALGLGTLDGRVDLQGVGGTRFSGEKIMRLCCMEGGVHGSRLADAKSRVHYRGTAENAGAGERQVRTLGPERLETATLKPCSAMFRAKF